MNQFGANMGQNPGPESALPMVPKSDDDNHDADDESDDCDDNHHEDDKDGGSHDNYHRSILCIPNAAESEIMMVIRTMMIRMMTVMIISPQRPLHYQWCPNAKFEMYRRKR